jgi:hypothetical protein
MHVTSLELSKELYELSGWKGTNFWHGQRISHLKRKVYFSTTGLAGEIEALLECPAYDLGYLVDKLPELNHAQEYLLMEASPIGYAFGYASYGELIGVSGTDYSPEDAAAKLCIELFKQGILTKPNNTVKENTYD